MLAVHYEAAGDWDAARRAATQAAEAAEQTFALEEAVRSYRIAVEAARRSAGAADDLAGLLEALGRVSVAGGWAKEGLEAFSSARKLIADAVARARLDHERAYALNILGRHDEAVRGAAHGAPGARRRGRRRKRRPRRRLRDRSRPAPAAGALGGGARARERGDRAARRSTSPTSTTTRVLADALRYHDIAASELEGDAGDGPPRAARSSCTTRRATSCRSRRC